MKILTFFVAVAVAMGPVTPNLLYADDGTAATSIDEVQTTVADIIPGAVAKIDGTTQTTAEAVPVKQNSIVTEITNNNEGSQISSLNSCESNPLSCQNVTKLDDSRIAPDPILVPPDLGDGVSVDRAPGDYHVIGSGPVTVPGSIHGTVFEDRNANKTFDPGEPLIAGRTIELLSMAAGSANLVLATSESDSQGNYIFSQLPPATYGLRENEMSSRWTETLPGKIDPNQVEKYIVTIESGSEITGKDFGNFKNIILGGYVWYDMNVDGIWQKAMSNPLGNIVPAQLVSFPDGEQISNEISLPNREVTVSLGSSIKTTITDVNGHYEIPFGPEELGNWAIAATPVPFWWQSYPGAPGTQNFTASTSGATFDNNNFGVVEYWNVLGMKVAPLSGIATSTTRALILENATTEFPTGTGESFFTVLPMTSFSRNDQSHFSIFDMVAEAFPINLLSGVRPGATVAMAIRFGIPNVDLDFSNPVGLGMYVGANLTTSTVHIRESVTGAALWDFASIGEPYSCTVIVGTCIFTTTKGSVFAGIYSTTNGSGDNSDGSGNGSGNGGGSGGGGGGGGGGGVGTIPPPTPPSDNPFPPPPAPSTTPPFGEAENGPTSIFTSAAHFNNRILALTEPNDQPIPSADLASQPTPIAQPDAPNPFLASIANLLTFGTGNSFLAWIFFFLLALTIYLFTRKIGKKEKK